eukprot:TRINITY_DN17741_c0_g1_i3.p1 TRINITY_DN17741_c0_g1~~TRINITY_DN17741_c0_g1_i3.p1  ORF type:complete len:212 (+),score=54.43 TRINITY_DN17741_c0_g1_i3:57-692(+)
MTLSFYVSTTFMVSVCHLIITYSNLFFFFFFQAEDGIRDAQESRGLGDVYKRQQHHSSVKWADTVIPLTNEHLVFIADQLQGWKRRVSELDGQLLRPLQAAFKSSPGSPTANPSRHSKIYSLYFHGGADSASNLDSTSEDVEHLLIKHSEVVRLLDVFLTAIQGLGSNAVSQGINTVLLQKEGGKWELCPLPLVERFAASVLDALPFITHN